MAYCGRSRFGMECRLQCEQRAGSSETALLLQNNHWALKAPHGVPRPAAADESKLIPINFAMTLAAAQLGMIGAANTLSSGARAASLPLNVGYAEAGPADGPPVILLHGWPYDIYSFVDAAPLLASAGYRVVIPYLRGYGTTTFLSSATMRNARQSAVGFGDLH